MALQTFTAAGLTFGQYAIGTDGATIVLPSGLGWRDSVTGDWTEVNDATPLPIADAGLLAAYNAAQGTARQVADASPPFQQFGIAATPGNVTATATLVIAANPARKLLSLSNAGWFADEVNDPFNAARIWYAFGQPPVIGNGAYLDPGDARDFYTQADVQAVIDPAAVTAGLTSLPLSFEEHGA